MGGQESHAPVAQLCFLMNGWGAVVMSVFGAVWCLAGLHAHENTPVWTYSIPIAVTVAIVLVAARVLPKRLPPSAEAARRAGRVLGISSAVEGVAMFVAANVLSVFGASAYLASTFAVIVGLHFLPIAKWAPFPPYWVTGGALTLLGLGSVAVAEAPVRSLLVGIGAAVILWGSSVVVLRGSR
jgi:hypothetical protein